jgi:four helix bundle protein
LKNDAARCVLGSALARAGEPTSNGMMMLLQDCCPIWTMQDFRKIRAWQENRQLVAAVYKATSSFPSSERFGLTDQLRRSVMRIGACIAEGCGRRTRADTLHFFQMAFSSATEVLHHLITAADLGFITALQFEELEGKLGAVRRMIAGFMKKLGG